MTLPPLSREPFVFSQAGALHGDAKTRKLPCDLAACTKGISRRRSRLIENCVMLKSVPEVRSSSVYSGHVLFRSVHEKSSPPIGTRVREKPAPRLGSNSWVST